MRAASLGGLLILAGLLEPVDFGLVAVATLTAGGVNVVFATGAHSAVQALGRGQDLERAALMLNLLLGIGVGLLLIVVAGPLTGALGEPEAKPLLQVLALAIPLGRWSDVRLAVLEREFLFAHTTVVQLVATGVGLLTGILAALADAGPWAIVYQALAAEGVVAVGVTLHPVGQHVPGWKVAELRRLVGFGRELAGNAVMTFLFTNADDAVVVRIAGAQALGFYDFAYRVSNGPTYMLTHAASRVMLPTYMALKEQGRAWGPTYCRLVRILAWITGTVMLGILLYGPSLLGLLYGDRWRGSYDALRILAVYGLFRSVGATTGSVFVAAGFPKQMRQITQWQTAAMLAIIVPAVMVYGLEGAAWAVTVPLVVATVVALWRAARVLDVRAWTVYRDLAMTWAAAAGANLVALPITRAVGGWGGLTLAGATVGVLMAAYGHLVLREEFATLRGHLAKEPEQR